MKAQSQLTRGREDRRPLDAFIENGGCVILDGGLATALETYGFDLANPLWSARVLLENPHAIVDVHRAYLKAGADCIATATYQATLPGFQAAGLTPLQSRAHLENAVRLAAKARDEFWANPANRGGRIKPLVAGSVGPYGAYLADGSEYSGQYGLSVAELVDFHQERWEILADSGADLIAVETVPSAAEAEALLRLLADSRPDTWAWISFSCRDGMHISDGTPLVELARMCDEVPNLAALGINCTAPRHIDSLIGQARLGTDKPVLVYPNSGETYDARLKIWTGPPERPWWREAPRRWLDLGASGVGGCCRVGPEAIAEIRAGLLD